MERSEFITADPDDLIATVPAIRVDVLKRPVGPRDELFAETGADSLTAPARLACARRLLSVRISAASLFVNPTPEGMASAIEGVSSGAG